MRPLLPILALALCVAACQSPAAPESPPEEAAPPQPVARLWAFLAEEKLECYSLADSLLWAAPLRWQGRPALPGSYWAEAGAGHWSARPSGPLAERLAAEAFYVAPDSVYRIQMPDSAAPRGPVLDLLVFPNDVRGTGGEFVATYPAPHWLGEIYVWLGVQLRRAKQRHPAH